MKYLLILIIAIIHVSAGYSQNESGQRSISFENFELGGLKACDTTLVFHKKYPILQSIPPLNTGMPFIIMLSYIYLDSVARNINYSQYKGYLDTLSFIDDTLSRIANFYYQTVDYDPIRFRQYEWETQLNQSGTYVKAIDDIGSDVRYKYKELSPDSIKEPLFAMLSSDHILRVKVISIDSMKSPNNYYGADTVTHEYYDMLCEVQDTIKGQIFNQYIPPAFLINGDSENSTVSYITISFSRAAYPQNTQLELGYTPKFERDPLLMDYKGDFMPDIGQEMIVFTNRHDYMADPYNDYFKLSVRNSYSNGALPIIQNVVHDVNNIWSSDTHLTYSEWRNRYQTLLNILTEQE